MPSQRLPTAPRPFHPWTRSSGLEMRTSPRRRPLLGGPRDRPFARARARSSSFQRPGRPAWIRGGPHRASRARSRRRGDSPDAVRKAGPGGCARTDEADAGRGACRSGYVGQRRIVLTRTIGEAIGLCERMAPEHVVCDTDAVAGRITRAGTVFVGDFSAQASGDYATGSNHVLPTSGAARARGGLSAADFVRVSTVQRLSAAGIRHIGPAAVALAGAEGLSAHAASIQLRLGSDPRRPGMGSDFRKEKR